VRLGAPDRDDEVTRLSHTLNATLDCPRGRFGNRAPLRQRRQPREPHRSTLLKTRVQLARGTTTDRRRAREAVLAEIETDLVRLTELTSSLCCGWERPTLSPMWC
jgi:hypothetical protein